MVLMQDVRAANVRAITHATVLALDRENFNRHLGQLSDIRHMWRLQALGRVSSPALAADPSWSLPSPASVCQTFCGIKHTLPALQSLPCCTSGLQCSTSGLPTCPTSHGCASGCLQHCLPGQLTCASQCSVDLGREGLKPGRAWVVHGCETHRSLVRWWVGCGQVPLLGPLTLAQRGQLCTALQPLRHIPAGTVLVRRGEPGDAFYIVESGTCQVLGDSNQVS